MQNSDRQFYDQVHEWNISEDQAGHRLDRYLASRMENLSRTSIQQMITEGLVLVNGRGSKPGYALRSGDEVRVVQVVARPYTGKAAPQPLPLDIVYEDQDVLVINKAAGMVVHP